MLSFDSNNRSSEKHVTKSRLSNCVKGHYCRIIEDESQSVFGS